MIRCQASACYDHMNMRVELKVLSPGMQDGRDSRHCAEIFSVGTQFQYRFGRRLKQQCVHGALPVSKNGIQLRRNGENNMKIRRVKQVFPLLVDPLFFCKRLAFGAVSVPAGVVRNPHISAVITGIYVRTQSSCPAIDDVLHSFSLIVIHPMTLGISADVLRENILNLNAHCCTVDQRGLQGLLQHLPNADKR